MTDITKYTHLVGRAGRDVKRTDYSGPKAKFSLAVEVGYDKEKKEVLTEWVDVAVWGELAESLFSPSVAMAEEAEAPLVRKGARVWVAGKTSTYASASGDRKQISAREVGLVERFLVGKAGAAPSMITVESELDGVTDDDEW